MNTTLNRFFSIFLVMAVFVSQGCLYAGKQVTPEMASTQEDSELLWYDAGDLLVEGKGWDDTENFWERLPARAKGNVPEAVWKLSKHTAGLCVRFITDSRTIGAIWDGGGAMYHMAATGNSGLDLYMKETDGWRFIAVGKPLEQRTMKVLKEELPGTSQEYLLYLPLYNDVTELKIGIDEGASIAPAEKRKTRPILFYGTSITQGGCASRCGMCHPALLGRWLDREVINLGFSGAGKMEPVMADLVAEQNPEIFVLECLPNMTTQMVTERIRPFVHALRKAHPETPILLVENPYNHGDTAGNVALRKEYEILKKENVKNLCYLEGEKLLPGPENGTVDGVHPTDLGFYRMAVAFRPVIKEILNNR